MDIALAIIVLIVAVGLFVKFRVLPRSKTARKAADKFRDQLK